MITRLSVSRQGTAGRYGLDIFLKGTSCQYQQYGVYSTHIQGAVMEPFNKITGFEWDSGNEQKNLKHAVVPNEVEQVFLNEPLLVLNDLKHSYRELRYHALGRTTDGRLLHITFTIRTNRIRIISARDMHRKERVIYEQET